MSKKRTIALQRASELKSRITDYTDARKHIPTGFNHQSTIAKRQKHIMKMLDASQAQFDDYKWQLKNRIEDVETLQQLMSVSETEAQAIKAVSQEYRFAISPYYLSLINPEETLDPIKLLAMPSALELDDYEGKDDPMNEEYTNPKGRITRRYPDRLIINVTNECAMYCRHCQRRRNIGLTDIPASKSELQESLDYIADNNEIREVLITGGDAFLLSDELIDWLLKKLRNIKHVEVIRFGSRTLVTLPQRITPKLVSILKKYHPIYVNTHFNHPIEVTLEAKEAAAKLANAGVPIGNQAVLLNGINNDKFIMRALNHELLKIRVKPYYIFHAKTVTGTRHFQTSIDDGINIIEHLRGYTSGMAIPTFIVNAPGGKGKTPILPQYIISRGPGHCMIRTWEGEVMQVDNPQTLNLKEQYADHLKKIS